MDWTVILAGGSGTRFWPLSTPARPKQLLPLAGPLSTAEETARLVSAIVPKSRLLLITGPLLADAFRERLDLPPENILIEPRAASTGPALAWVTAEAVRRDPSATLLSVHADWLLSDPTGFQQAAEAALLAARMHDRLITVGIVPARPETRFGYIVPGDELGGNIRSVSRFVEKPPPQTALDLMASGALWNSGMFAWRGPRLLTEISEHTPEIAPHMIRLAEGDVRGFFEHVTAVSIDVGVLERSARVAVIPGHFDWDDLGTWDALGRVRPRDAHGNVAVGPVTLVDSQDCVAWSDGTPLVISGMRDTVVVSANGRILVLPRAAAPDLKRTLDALPDQVRDLGS